MIELPPAEEYQREPSANVGIALLITLAFGVIVMTAAAWLAWGW